jgi:hypothetical protein
MNWNELKKCRPDVPLLLLYPINANSKASVKSETRSDLEATGDLLGIGIVFPGEMVRGGEYFAVELEAPTPEQLDDEEVVEETDNGEVVSV